MARWTWKSDGNHKIVRLNIEAKSPFGSHMSQYQMYYQGWAWGACSCASLWGWNHIPERIVNEETLAGFIRVFLHEVVPTISSWNPHRVFAQVPLSGYDEATEESNARSPFFEYLIDTVYPGVEPVYSFTNRSHKSTTQRLFDLDTDIMADWLRKYDATHPAKPVEEKPVAPIAATSSDIGTIIFNDLGNLPAPTIGAVKLNRGGQRPLAPGEYFTR